MIEEKECYECVRCRMNFDVYEEFIHHNDSVHLRVLDNRKISKKFKEKEEMAERAVRRNNKFLNDIAKIEDEMMGSLKLIEDELNSSSDEKKKKLSNEKKSIKDFVTKEMLDVGTLYPALEDVDEVAEL